MKRVATVGSTVMTESGTSKILEGSSKLFIQGKRASVVGDRIESHSFPNNDEGNTYTTHSNSIILTGSNKLLISGKQVAIEGSTTSCGVVISGSDKVLIKTI